MEPDFPEFIELNLANYSEEDVAQLNAWAIWAKAQLDAHAESELSFAALPIPERLKEFAVAFEKLGMRFNVPVAWICFMQLVDVPGQVMIQAGGDGSAMQKLREIMEKAKATSTGATAIPKNGSRLIIPQ